jgi:hypothetical protein
MATVLRGRTGWLRQVADGRVVSTATWRIHRHVRTVGEVSLKFCRPRSQTGSCRGVLRTPRGSSPAWRGHRSATGSRAASDWRRLTLKVRTPRPSHTPGGASAPPQTSRGSLVVSVRGLLSAPQNRRTRPMGPDTPETRTYRNHHRRRHARACTPVGEFTQPSARGRRQRARHAGRGPSSPRFAGRTGRRDVASRSGPGPAPRPVVPGQTRPALQAGRGGSVRSSARRPRRAATSGSWRAATFSRTTW